MTFDAFAAVNLGLFDGAAGGGAAGGGAMSMGNADGINGTGTETVAWVESSPPPDSGEGRFVRETHADAARNHEGTALNKFNVEKKQFEGANESERRTAFEKFVKEYKDLYGEKMQEVINKRFKETKTLEGQLEKWHPLMKALCDRFGTDDAKSIQKALFVEGQSIETAQHFETMQATIDEQKALIERLTRQEQNMQKLAVNQNIQHQVQAWQKEANELFEQNNGFDLAAELQKPEFKALLRSGLSMQEAFDMMHYREAGEKAALRAEENLTKSIVARGYRPVENGVSGAGVGYIVKNDVRNFNAQDRLAIAQRVKNGERVRL